MVSITHREGIFGEQRDVMLTLVLWISLSAQECEDMVIRSMAAARTFRRRVEAQVRKEDRLIRHMSETPLESFGMTWACIVAGGLVMPRYSQVGSMM